MNRYRLVRCSRIGIGEGEFESREQLEGLIDRASIKVTMHDCYSHERLFGFSMMYPSPLSRSYAPKYSGQFQRWIIHSKILDEPPVQLSFISMQFSGKIGQMICWNSCLGFGLPLGNSESDSKFIGGSYSYLIGLMLVFNMRSEI